MSICEETSASAPWSVIVDSIGSADAGIVSVLRSVLPLAEPKIAALLYRAPARLFEGLPEAGARELCQILRTAGLECRAVDEHHILTSGDADHEIALVVRSFEQMTGVLEQVMRFLGVDLATATRMLCAAPTVLVSGVSATTVEALRARMAPFSVELDVSRPAAAIFDVFLAECSAAQRQQALRVLADEKVQPAGQDGEAAALLAADLSHSQSTRLWARFSRGSLPVRIVNRDFQRFDLCLDEAPRTPEMLAYLQASTGMPAKVAQKVPDRTPLVLQQSVRFADLVAHLEQISALGGKASGHLQLFQRFSVKIDDLGERRATGALLRSIGAFKDPDVELLLARDARPLGSLTQPQARWLQSELKKVGTDLRLVLQ